MKRKRGDVVVRDARCLIWYYVLREDIDESGNAPAVSICVDGETGEIYSANAKESVSTQWEDSDTVHFHWLTRESAEVQ